MKFNYLVSYELRGENGSISHGDSLFYIPSLCPKALNDVRAAVLKKAQGDFPFMRFESVVFHNFIPLVPAAE